VTTPVIPDEAVEALVDAWNEEGWSWPYMARVSHFTEEQIAAGMLTAADAESNANNRDFARTLVTAAAPAILAANGPRVISSAADILALGEAVRDGDPGACVLLVEEGASRNGVVWTIGYLRPHEVGEAPLMVCADLNWVTDRVTDDGISGHGPWRVVWSRGVEL